jgi:two-component system, chemotaxis family, sensor kinase CheA
MGRDNSEFAENLLATFRGEAEGHLNTIAAGLIELEKPVSPERRAAVVESVFRETHTLKGAARSVNLVDIEKTCQALESVFSAAKQGEIILSREIFDLLHQSVSILETFLKGTEPEIKTAHKRSRDIIRHLNEIALVTASIPIQPEMTKAEPAPESPEVAEPEKTGPAGIESQADTIRISTARLDSLMLKAEELGDAKRAVAQRSSDLGRICRQFAPWKQRWAGIRNRLPALRRSARSTETQKHQERKQTEFAKITDFLEYNAEFVHNLESELVRQKTMISADHQFLLERTDTLIDDMKGLLMMPAGFMLESFPRFVREFSRDKNKEVDLVIEGQEIMIDRRILDEMKDAFMHMMRNAIDHGIELAETRIGKGKARSGKIIIRFSYREGKNVEILMEDDGAGIDSNNVGAAAVKAGILKKEELDHFTDHEILSLIFRSGITTSRIITDTSGRGLGLAIAMEKVDRLGGSIEVDTIPGKGTLFRILLPLTLATFNGLIVNESRQTFVFPLKSVERVIRVSPETIKTIEGQKVIELENEPLALVRLADALGIPPHVPDKEPLAICIVVVIFADKRLGLSVDEIGYAQDVMVKGLGRQLPRVRNIASATVLGTGKVVPVVNIGDLMKSAIRLRSGGATFIPATEEEKAKKKKTVLVTEDSITSRMLLKNILEGGGYKVETAMDGMDAFTKLRSGSFDIVVSDVDMPRMNGFVLTEKIRSDKKYAELPVVLVTALDSQQDRERGIEVGANAYIVKSSFDQSNLLEVVQRLIGK